MNRKKIQMNFVNIITIIVILGILIWIIIEQKGEMRIQKENSENLYKSETISSENLESSENSKNSKNANNLEDKKIYPKEEIIQNYKGYDVCAKLEIPSISLETYILKKYSAEALNISVTKFWGVEPNNIGNFCIAGHNFKNRDMFYNIKNLELGEKIFITDNKIGKVEYEVFKMDSVVPEDVSCLKASTQNKREITLITCTNDSKMRIIVKAKEVEK